MSGMPSPVFQPATAPFFEAGAKGPLRLQRCAECGEALFFPRLCCPECSSDRVEWFEASGHGMIYSYTVTYQKGRPMRAPAYVTLAEGPTVLSAIVQQNFDDIRIGQQVTAVFLPEGPEGALVLSFRPRDAAS